MKKLKIITMSLILSVAISGCEKESIDLPLEESIQTPILTIEDYMKSGGKVGPFEVKQVEGQNDILKSHITIGDVDIYNNQEEFLLSSSDLFYIDFTGPPAPVFQPLNEFSDDGTYSPGDIPEGISFNTLNLNQNTNHFVRFNNNLIVRLYSGDPKVFFKLTMDFNLKVQKVAFDVITLNLFGTLPGGTTIVVEGANGVIHSQIVYPSNSLFFGIETQEPISRILIYTEQVNSIVGVDNVYFGEFPDTDSDGCIDQKDSIPTSNMETTVQVGSCNSGVENRVTSVCGVMMSDKIDEIMRNTTSQRALFQDFSILTNTWVGEGLINTQEQNALLQCASPAPVQIPIPPRRRTRLGRG